MLKYKVNSVKRADSSHGLLVIPPLIITLVFCYGLMMMPSKNKSVDTSSAASKQATPLTAKAAAALPEVSDVTPAALPSLTPADPEDAPASNAVTATPQPSTDSGSSLQSATPTTISPTQAINVSTNTTTKTLTNNITKTTSKTTTTKAATTKKK